jgi:hypothetical protein
MTAALALSTVSFAIANVGASRARMAIGAVPFLLPLLFQVGFGLHAFHAGLLLAVFAGNPVVKVGTTRELRAFGLRRVRLVNGLLNAASILARALLSRATPVLVAAAVLFAGLTRSMQFGAYNTIAFADIPRQRLAAANALFSTVLQLTMRPGVALCALGVRLGHAALGWLARIALLTGEFWIAFVLVAGSLRILFCAQRPGQLPHRTVGKENPDHLPRIAPDSADSVGKAAGRDALFVVENAVVLHQAVKILAVEDSSQKGSIR